MNKLFRKQKKQVELSREQFMTVKICEPSPIAREALLQSSDPNLRAIASDDPRVSAKAARKVAAKVVRF